MNYAIYFLLSMSISLNAGNWFNSANLESELFKEQETLKKEQALDSEEQFEMRILNKAGSIEITAWDKNVLSYEIIKSAPTKKDLKNIEIITEIKKNSGCFETKYGERSTKGTVKYLFSIPKNSTLKEVKTGSGSIIITGISGKINTGTGSGKIELCDVNGPINAQTGSGSIDINLENGTHKQPIHASTGSGSISIINARNSVTASSGKGSITLTQREIQSESKIKLNTGSGNIEVKIPSGSDVDIKASAAIGNISTQFKQLKASFKQVKGKLGRGGASLNISTGTGSIEINKLNMSQ